MKLEAMKCLVAILKSMGEWLNKQLRLPVSNSLNKSEALEIELGPGSPQLANGNADESAEGSDTYSESPGGTSDALAIEQRRAYKLELQVRM